MTFKESNMYIIREVTQGDCNGIGKVYCDSWKVAYRNVFLKTYLDSLTVTNCISDKVYVNDIVQVK